jgi:hypothetical protein
MTVRKFTLRYLCSVSPRAEQCGPLITNQIKNKANKNMKAWRTNFQIREETRHRQGGLNRKADMAKLRCSVVFNSLHRCRRYYSLCTCSSADQLSLHGPPCQTPETHNILKLNTAARVQHILQLFYKCGTLYVNTSLVLKFIYCKYKISYYYYKMLQR